MITTMARKMPFPPFRSRTTPIAILRWIHLYASGSLSAVDALTDAGIEIVGDGRKRAATLLKSPAVRREVIRLRRVYAEGAGVTQQRVVAELARLAFAPPEVARAWGPGGWAAKSRALETLARHTQVIRDDASLPLIGADQRVIVVYEGGWRGAQAPAIEAPGKVIEGK